MLSNLITCFTSEQFNYEEICMRHCVCWIKTYIVKSQLCSCYLVCTQTFVVARSKPTLNAGVNLIEIQKSSEINTNDLLVTLYNQVRGKSLLNPNFNRIVRRGTTFQIILYYFWEKYSFLLTILSFNLMTWLIRIFCSF